MEPPKKMKDAPGRPEVRDASVIVATKDRPELLMELLRSLSACAPLPAEVVLADDGSAQPVAQVVERLSWPFPVRVVRSERAFGPSTARNRAVHASRGGVLLFTDDDCVVDRGWVGALHGALVVEDEQLGGVGGRVIARDTDIYSRYFELHRVLEPRPHDVRHPARVPYLVTANCAVRRDVYMRAGGFDARLSIAGGDDVAFSMRIVRCGYHLEHAAEAVVRHRFRPGLPDFARTFYRYGLGGRYVVDRYLPR